MGSFPQDEDNRSYVPRKSSKTTKSTPNRAAKRTTASHDHSMSLDGRHKRVWKACERCRMKKTKCDGESPCKRCKDDGLLCQAGTRRKTEYKQAPKGYAEVLETSQFALTSTVQRLFKMIKNGEVWDLDEPDTNERGEPVIHDIVEKLGLLRQPSDLPITFAENETELVDVRRSLEEHDLQQSPLPSFATPTERTEASRPSLSDIKARKHSHDSTSSTPPLKQDRASSVESDASLQLPAYLSQASTYQTSNTTSDSNSTSSYIPSSAIDQLRINTYSSGHTPTTNTISTPSPLMDTYDSPMLYSNDDMTNSPFNTWIDPSENDWLSESHPLQHTARLFDKKPTSMPNNQQFPAFIGQGLTITPDMLKGMQGARDVWMSGDGTVRPSDMMGFGMPPLSGAY